MRKTALDDDASIYQKTEEETEKQKWQRMDKAQRRQYFLDYYLLKTIVISLLAALILYLVWTVVKPKAETVLYVAVVDEQLGEEEKQELIEELNLLYQADGKGKQVVIDDMFYLQEDALDKLQIFMYNHQIDIIIADEDAYEMLAGYGYFQSMDELLDEEAVLRYSKKYVSAAGYKEAEEVSFEDRETGQGEVLPYGIDLSGSVRFSRVKNYLEKPVLSIAAGAPNQENAVKFLDYILEAE